MVPAASFSWSARFWLSLVACFVTLSSAPLAALAVAAPNSNSGLTISPSSKDITLGSGLLQANVTIRLTNNSGKDLSGQLRLVDFKTLNESGGLSFGQVGIPLSKYGLANWMSLPNGNKVDVPNGKSISVLLNIDNRADLAPGGHYGAVVVSTGTPIATNGNHQISFNQELVSLIFVKKLGGEQYGLQLQSVIPGDHQNIPNSVQLRFKNTGNVQLTPRGYVTIIDPKKKLVAKGIINADSALVLPEARRSFTSLLQPIATSSATGNYTLNVFYRYDEKSDFGFTTLIINGKPSYRLPILAAVSLTLGIGVVGLVVVVRRRRTRVI